MLSKISHTGKYNYIWSYWNLKEQQTNSEKEIRFVITRDRGELHTTITVFQILTLTTYLPLPESFTLPSYVFMMLISTRLLTVSQARENKHMPTKFRKWETVVWMERLHEAFRCVRGLGLGACHCGGACRTSGHKEGIFWMLGRCLALGTLIHKSQGWVGMMEVLVSWESRKKKCKEKRRCPKKTLTRTIRKKREEEGEAS